MSRTVSSLSYDMSQAVKKGLKDQIVAHHPISRLNDITNSYISIL